MRNFKFESDINTAPVRAQIQPLSLPIQNSSEFIKDKFQCFAPTHHVAAIIGTTYQNYYSSGGHLVLDACKAVFTENQDGIRDGIVMSLAVGTNTSTDKRQENLAVAYASYYAKDFVEELHNSTASNILPNSAMAIGKRNADINSSSKTTIAAAKLTNTDNSLAINIGDGMLMVIDGETQQVKQLLKPRKYEGVKGTGRSPVHVEDLAAKENFSQYVECTDLNVRPNDIVILVSAGFVNTLATHQVQNLSSDVTFTQTDIDIDQLNQNIQSAYKAARQIYQSASPPAFAIAEQLIRHATNRVFEKRQLKIKIVHQMQNWVDQYYKEVCSPLVDRKKDLVKRIRSECAQQCTPQSFQDSYSLIMRFQSYFGQLNADGSESIAGSSAFKFVFRNDFIEELYNKINKAILDKVELPPHEKGKSHAENSSNSAFTQVQAYEIIIKALKGLLQQNQEEKCDEIMALVPLIFHEEINNFAKQITAKNIRPEIIRNAFTNFIAKIAEYNHAEVKNLIQLLLENGKAWQANLGNWVEDQGSRDLPARFITFIKDIYNLQTDAQGKMFAALLIPYINHFDRTQKGLVAALPKIAHNTIGDFKKWFNSTCNDATLCAELSGYLDQNNISDDAIMFDRIENQFTALVRLHSWKPGTTNVADIVPEKSPYFSLEQVKSGDDTSVTVAYVPDPAIEIIRKMFSYTLFVNDSRGKKQCEVLWQQFCALYADNKPSLETVEQIIAKLQTEKCVEQPNHRFSEITQGQKLEQLSSHVVPFYTEDQILRLRQFLLTKVKLQKEIQRIEGLHLLVINKTTIHDTLKGIILADNLTVMDRCNLYNQLADQQFAKLNEHRRIGIDRFFGINITRSWSTTLKDIRDKCLQKLIDETQALRRNGKFDEAVTLLKIAIEQPLFNTHRNNSMITGAYGDTAAVKKIRGMIDGMITAKVINENANAARPF